MIRPHLNVIDRIYPINTFAALPGPVQILNTARIRKLPIKRQADCPIYTYIRPGPEHAGPAGIVDDNEQG
ncbi:MAG: hypothetical protein RBT76_13485 [candidate division Zixibacteria bacterium]|jgi:hypothetical protein|nr:hypothetical protein [candidate division Zixibacteria bacterium]